jgi:hypothetical protein
VLKCPPAACPLACPPEEIAQRELLEEVGGAAADLHYIGQFYTSNGISNEVAYVYLATGVKLGKAHREPTELTEMHQGPLRRRCAWPAKASSRTGRARWRCSGADHSFSESILDSLHQVVQGRQQVRNQELECGLICIYHRLYGAIEEIQ